MVCRLNIANDIQKIKLYPNHPDYLATLEEIKLVNSAEMPDGLLVDKSKR